MKQRVIIFLLLILMLGGFFRFWNLKSTPPGLYPDEAINGMDATQSLKVFYPENNGREGLFIWLIALSFNLFGISIWSIRFVSAVIGFLTILGLFLLAKELFDEKIALLSSLFLAVSFWHVNFSRIGFRAIFVPFLMCFSFYFLLKGIKNKKLIYFIIAGIFFGLGFYTYIAFRACILLLGVLLLMEAWNYWQKNKSLKLFLKKIYIKDGWWRWDVFFIIVLIVVLPLCLHFYKVPQDFMGRANDISIFNSEQPLKEFAISSIKTAGMFNFIGDWNWRHNYSGAPMLAWTVGILFLIGLVISIKKYSNKNNIFIISWFFIMLLPVIFALDTIVIPPNIFAIEAPHALRSIGVIPVVYIFAALGFIWLFKKLSKKINKKLAIVFMAAILIHPVCANFNKYFCRWTNDPDVAEAFEQDLVDIGNYLNQTNAQKFLIANTIYKDVLTLHPDGLPMPIKTIMFIEKTRLQRKAQYGGQDTTYLKPENINQIKINKKSVIVLLRPDENLMDQLSNRWPNGKIKKENNIWSLLID